MLQLSIESKQQTDSRKKVIIVALITAVCLFGDSMLYVVLPVHWKEVGLLSLIEVGILLSANRFVRLPLNPFISWIYSMISVRSGLLLAAIIAGATTISYGIVKGFLLWLILRCIWGLAWSFFRIGAYLMILDLSSDENSGYLMGTYNGLYSVGSLVGVLVGALFVDLYGMQYITFVFGIMTFIILPLIIKFVPNSKNITASVRTSTNKRSAMKQPNILWLLASALIVMMCLEGMFSATLSHLIDERMPTQINILGIFVGAATVGSWCI